MVYGLWESAADMQVNEHRHAVLANNLANVNTAGLKGDLAAFMERGVESRQTGADLGRAPGDSPGRRNRVAWRREA